MSASEGYEAERLEGRDFSAKLRLVMDRFPRGLGLSREDLGLISWLYFYEQDTGAQEISDSQLKWLLLEAAGHAGMDPQSVQPAQIIQRLMRLDILRVALTDSSRRGYRLTCLGRSVARNVAEDIDYGSEQLNALLGSALSEAGSAGEEGGGSLFRYLKYIFLETIREKIEYKLLAIEEDLDRRKGAVKKTYSGQDQADFEAAIRDIEYCRMALTELVDAVQESSACVRLEELLHEHIQRRPEPRLNEALEKSLNFLYVLRGRVDVMLKDVVQFIRDCIAYRSLAFTVDSRERMCRIQEKILTHALTHDVRMPILEQPRIPRMDLNWSRQERERPVILDLERLRTLEGFTPPEPTSIEPEWKELLLDTARREWAEHASRGGIDLGVWLKSLEGAVPQLAGSACLGVWLLAQDLPKWTPLVMLEHLEGQWIPIDDEWMMEGVKLAPVPAAVLTPVPMPTPPTGSEGLESSQHERNG